VLERLKQQKLFAKLSKCSFFKAEVEFLGHYVGRAERQIFLQPASEDRHSQGHQANQSR